MDVTELMIGKQLRAGELPMDPAKMTLVTDPQRVIAHVVALRVEEEKPAEAVAADATAAPAEPEVIKKGKKEEEGEEGAAEPEARKQRPRRRKEGQEVTSRREKLPRSRRPSECDSSSDSAIRASNTPGRRTTWAFWPWTGWRMRPISASNGPRRSRTSGVGELAGAGSGARQAADDDEFERDGRAGIAGAAGD